MRNSVVAAAGLDAPVILMVSVPVFFTVPMTSVLPDSAVLTKASDTVSGQFVEAEALGAEELAEGLAEALVELELAGHAVRVTSATPATPTIARGLTFILASFS